MNLQEEHGCQEAVPLREGTKCKAYLKKPHNPQLNKQTKAKLKRFY